MSYQGENVERAVYNTLVEHLAAALAAVQAEWTATDPMVLPVPVNWARGYRTWMLDLASTQYPFVLVIVPLRTPESSQAGRIDFQDSQYSVMISAFLVADTEAQAVSLAHRYAQALVNVLRAHRTITGFSQVNPEPLVRILVDNQMHIKAGTMGDQSSAEDVDYLRLVEIEQTIEVLS